MDTSYIIPIFCFIPIVIAIVVTIDWAIQSPYDYKEKITQQLSEKGYQLIDISMPGIFKTGPFSKFQISFGPQTSFMGVSGEKTRYRIVKYKNQSGVIKQSWIRINVTAFVVVRIKWIPEL
jgi:hypothetical protein